MKDIKNLQKDIYHVLNTGEGWTDEISSWVGYQISKSLTRQLQPRTGQKANLRMSNLGQPCDRKNCGIHYKTLHRSIKKF